MAAAPKTRPTDVDVASYLATVTNERRRRDASAVVELMREVTGQEPRMWGPTMIGFGALPYTNTTGTHEWFVVGLAPRAAALTIYGIWNAYDPDPRLDQLGPHTRSTSCVYVKDLAALDTTLLRTLVADSWQREHSRQAQGGSTPPGGTSPAGTPPTSPSAAAGRDGSEQ